MVVQLRRFFLRLCNVFRPGRAEPDLSRELDSHLALIADELQRQGMAPDDAHLAARRAFGGVELTKELHRNSRSFVWLDDARRDVQYAVRTFARNPGFTLVAVLTLALGIGANTAIFSVVNGVLLQPLPYKDSARLVRIVENIPADRSITGTPSQIDAIRLQDLVEWRTRSHALSPWAAYLTTSMTLTGHNDATSLVGVRASSALFSMLGGQARLGRVFDDAEERRGADAVVVLSDRAWRTHFLADPGVLSRVVTLDPK